MKTYIISQIKKMSTSRLQDLFVKVYGAFPANPFDRTNLICRVYDAMGDREEIAIQEAKMAARDAEPYEVRAARIFAGVNMIMSQMKLEKEGKEERGLNDSDIIAICAMYEDGISAYSIGKMYGKGAQYIKNIAARKIYKDVRISWNYKAS